mmetsp:Transcript_2732/g.6613  ORF Transcript_2732/g.6613 Transcript_2732/m.6613 type:complete len:353 (-) Transcript_2732:256-1314(-)
MATTIPLLDTALDDPEKGATASTHSGNTPRPDGRAGFIIKVSLFVALAWWGFGLYTVISTKSLAVLASLVDATIDLAAQGVLLAANSLSAFGGKGSSYPVGVARLEPVGVVVCSVLMAMASGAVIYDSGATLVEYWPAGPNMVFTDLASLMLSVVVVIKIIVWRIAKFEYEKNNNVSLEALALDNFNDILSNGSALLFASVTRLDSKLWWLDPTGGILISIYIIRSWFLTMLDQINMLVGREANDEFLETIRGMAEKHHEEAEVDIVRAYHFGPKFLVEVELVMDKDTPLSKSHDVGMLLQHEIELLEECERCFVHIDYQKRSEDDHDRTVPIHFKTNTPVNQLRKGSFFRG